MHFDRIVCGVDDTDEGVEAVRQAARIASPEARLIALGVVDAGAAVHAGWAAADVVDQIERGVERRLAQVEEEVPTAAVRMIRGRSIAALLEVIDQEDANLLAVGTHGHSRAGGIALTSVATTLLHEAPCSVLVARRSSEPGTFPGAIIVGVDGSTESKVAARTAGQLAKRLGATVAALVAVGGEADVELAGELGVDLERDERKPVPALVARAREGDLLVVGSRGLHGVRALGSVSERVAHRAPSSVLVVRA